MPTAYSCCEKASCRNRLVHTSLQNWSTTPWTCSTMTALAFANM